MKNFKLTTNTKTNAFGVKLYQIECTVDNQFAKVGDLGGWIEKEENLNGNAWVFGNAQVSGNARVLSSADYCCFQSFGSEGRTTTAFKEKEGNIRIVCGSFNGAIDEFVARVKETHGDNQYAREYLAIAEVIKAKFGL